MGGRDVAAPTTSINGFYNHRPTLQLTSAVSSCSQVRQRGAPSLHSSLALRALPVLRPVLSKDALKETLKYCFRSPSSDTVLNCKGLLGYMGDACLCLRARYLPLSLLTLSPPYAKAVIYRKYRDGELPDIQIQLGDVLRPLQHLSMMDGGIAREVFVQIFKVSFSVTVE